MEESNRREGAHYGHILPVCHVAALHDEAVDAVEVHRGDLETVEGDVADANVGVVVAVYACTRRLPQSSIPNLN